MLPISLHLRTFSELLHACLLKKQGWIQEKHVTGYKILMFGFSFFPRVWNESLFLYANFPSVISFSHIVVSMLLSVPFLPFALFCSAWLYLEAVSVLNLVSQPFLFLLQSVPPSDAAFPPLGLRPLSFIVGILFFLFWIVVLHSSVCCFLVL